MIRIKFVNYFVMQSHLVNVYWREDGFPLAEGDGHYRWAWIDETDLRYLARFKAELGPTPCRFSQTYIQLPYNELMPHLILDTDNINEVGRENED